MARLVARLGFAIRETGQALDRLGCRLQGAQPYAEECACGGGRGRSCAEGAEAARAGSAAARGRPRARLRPSHPRRPTTSSVFRHRALQPVAGAMPTLGAGVFVAPSATVAGDVALGDRASVWFGAVIRGEAERGRGGGGAARRPWPCRPPPFLSDPPTPPPHPPSGDDARVTIGDATNVQDGAVLRTTPSPSVGGPPRPLALGRGVTVGHGASIGAGAVVGDAALIGMGASVGEDAIVEGGAMVAAGAVVPPGATIPAGELWGGSPAARMRGLKPEEAAFLPASAERYAELAAAYIKEGASAGPGR